MIINSLQQIKLVDRVELIQRLCRGKRVLHLGATDAPSTIEAVSSGRLLHLHLSNVSAYIRGMDINADMIEWLKHNRGIKDIMYGDIEKLEDYPDEDFDTIIAGEILEHLSNPGKALANIHAVAKPFTKLVVSVPNAYSLKGVVRAFWGHELIHPDHVLHHSPHTLKGLLERNGFLIDSYFSFFNGGKGLAAFTANMLLRYKPQLAEGIGAICSPVIAD